MPMVTVHTSARRLPADLCESTTDAVAKALGKPHGRVNVCVQQHNTAGAAVTLTRGGLSDGPPCALVSIVSIGKVDKETNEKSAKSLTEHFAKALDIKPECVWISYADVAPHCIASGGLLACNA